MTCDVYDLKAVLTSKLVWYMRQVQLPACLLLVCFPVLYAFYRVRKPRRLSRVPKNTERVLILGATSGIGREIARQYAKRGARVCVVGRRPGQLEDLVVECKGSTLKSSESGQNSCFGVRADFTNVGDMVRVRAAVEDGGLIVEHPFLLTLLTLRTE